MQHVRWRDPRTVSVRVFRARGRPSGEPFASGPSISRPIRIARRSTVRSASPGPPRWATGNQAPQNGRVGACRKLGGATRRNPWLQNRLGKPQCCFSYYLCWNLTVVQKRRQDRAVAFALQRVFRRGLEQRPGLAVARAPASCPHSLGPWGA